MGKHLVSDLKIPRWTENDNQVLKYIQALVAVSKPSISSKKGMDHDFEDDLTAKPLLELKRSRRHQKAKELLERDPMIIVPKEQIQGMAGLMESDVCSFDFFTNTVKPARNVKKDLKQFMKKRAQYSISNLKLPELDGKESKYRPLKHMEPVENSASLQFSTAMAV